MAKEPCDACGVPVTIAGGISGLWSASEGTGGMTLAFDDGTEYFLCFDCIERFPEDPDQDDVASLTGQG